MDLTRDRIKLNPNVKTSDLSQAQGKEVEKDRSVSIGVY